MKKLTCIVCPNGCEISIEKSEGDWIVTGNLCQRGKEFAINEIINPKRSICSTVKTIYKEVPRLAVRTDGEIPFKDIFPLMKLLSTVIIDRHVHSGEVIIENAINTGVNVIATSDMDYLIQEGNLLYKRGRENEGK